MMKNLKAIGFGFIGSLITGLAAGFGWILGNKAADAGTVQLVLLTIPVNLVAALLFYFIVRGSVASADGGPGPAEGLRSRYVGPGGGGLPDRRGRGLAYAGSLPRLLRLNLRRSVGGGPAVEHDAGQHQRRRQRREDHERERVNQ